jgi:hypothetical protein
VSSSSPTAAGGVDLSAELAGDLLAALAAVPDPRRGGARRHPVGYVLGVLVVSFACAGFESFAGAAQWAAGADRGLLLALGAAPDPLTGAVAAPSEATLRRVASGVDADALEAVIAAWTAAGMDMVNPEGATGLPVAVDGKTVRGARDGHRAAPHLLAAATHDRSVVLAQRRVPDKTNELQGRCAAPGWVENGSRPAWSTPRDLGAGESVNELGVGASGRRPRVLPVST